MNENDVSNLVKIVHIICNLPVKPNVFFQWLALLLREVTDSNLGSETNYRNEIFMVFPSPSRQVLE